MKHLPNIVGAILGIAFITFAVQFFLTPPSVPDSSIEAPGALFMRAMLPTGFFAFIKACELLGGLLTAIPRTRRLGLVILGPIVVNIVVFNILIKGGNHVFDWPVLLVTGLLIYLLWDARGVLRKLIA